MLVMRRLVKIVNVNFQIFFHNKALFEKKILSLQIQFILKTIIKINNITI